MAFATAIAFYGQSVYGNITVSLFVLLVISYMFKDRLKDIFRTAFKRTIGARFPDVSQRLYESGRVPPDRQDRSNRTGSPVVPVVGRGVVPAECDATD